MNIPDAASMRLKRIVNGIFTGGISLLSGLSSADESYLANGFE